MSRAMLLVLDSVGIGGAPDASAYGDEGADTVGHIAEACAAGRGDRAGLRAGPLRLPHLVSLGLGRAAGGATGRMPPGLEGEAREGRWGHAVERSAGKDTPSGHWELAGCPVPQAWGTFPRTVPCFPLELTDALVREAGLPGLLGLRHASGTEILDELGEECRASDRPIAYTSADSVFQIAAHEEAFGLERLYEVCRIARRLCDPYRIGRVIARPYTGQAGAFARTANRRDYAVPPPPGTLLDRAAAAGRPIVSVGKIGDIFAHRSTGRELKGAGTDALVDRTLEAWASLPEGGLLIANYVDFDTLHGHRRDVAGYAAALEAFDARVPALLAGLGAGDLMVLTADHGCDPTWTGTDHTREQVPVLLAGPQAGPGAGPLGRLDGFSEVAALLARHLGL